MSGAIWFSVDQLGIFTQSTPWRENSNDQFCFGSACAVTYFWTPEQRQIRDSVSQLCQRFDDQYWLDRDNDGVFPEDFCRAFADAGWMGIAMPQEYGGSGLGITEAAVMAQAITESGAGNAGFAALVIGIFGLNPVVVFGTEAQKRRWLPPIIQRQDIACFAVTEPNTGLDTTRLKTRAVLQGDRYVVNGEKIWTSTAQQSNKMLLIARTIPDTKKPIDGLSLFYTISTAITWKFGRSTKWAASPSIPTRSS